jgi:phytoene dehydrogenase-like protein
VDWALAAPIPWKAKECGQAGTIHVGGTLEEVSRSELDCWMGIHSDRPFVMVGQPSIDDPTRAPLGKHTAWGYCHVPSGSSQDMTSKIEAQIERFAPGFRDAILARFTRNADTWEEHNPNLVGGDVVGGVTDLWQLFSRPVLRLNPYATPLPGVYICSASTPPGAGVHGLCGYFAAKSALRYLGL